MRMEFTLASSMEPGKRIRASKRRCNLNPRKITSSALRWQNRPPAEQANSEVDEIEMRVQVQLDGAEIAQTAEACNGNQRIDRAKDQTKPPRAICALPESSPKRDCAADKVKYVMGRRKCEMEHFMAKEPHHADYDQDRRSAQHRFLPACSPLVPSWMLIRPRCNREMFVELTARMDVPSSPQRFWLLGKRHALGL